MTNYSTIIVYVITIISIDIAITNIANMTNCLIIHITDSLYVLHWCCIIILTHFTIIYIFNINIIIFNINIIELLMFYLLLIFNLAIT